MNKIMNAHFHKVKGQEKLAKALIYFFTGLTIFILLWIVGYILFRGFYYDNSPQYEVLDLAETSLFLDNNIEEMVFICNDEVKAKDLTVSQIRTLFTKERRDNWGFYTSQDIKVNPFTYSIQDLDSHNFAQAAQDFLLNDSATFSEYTNEVSSPEEMIQLVAETSGGMGFVPASYIPSLKGVKIIETRRLALVVNPSVLEIEDNIRLDSLDREAVVDIFKGSKTNWNEIGGINLPVVPVFLEDDRGADLYTSSFTEEEMNLPQNSLKATEKEDFLNKLTSIPGSVGIVDYTYALNNNLSIVNVERRERGLNLNLDFLLKPPARSGKWGGISYIIINTLFLVLFTLLFSTPIGIGAGIYLVEYAKQGRMLRILRMGTETLAAIPSVIFGLFGNIFFVRICGMGIGFISSTLTVTLMILPTIIRTTEEALKSVPASLREGSLALGATKLQTTLKVVLPAASPGILTGVILAVGRTIGETAVLLYTLGSSYQLVSSPTSSARVLSLHLYLLFSEAISFDRAFATAAVLVFIVLFVNLTTTKLVGKMNLMSGKK